MNSLKHGETVIGNVYKKYRNGDPISDRELEISLAHLPDMLETLHSLGERFHHSWFDLYQMFVALEGFKHARKRNSKKFEAEINAVFEEMGDG